MEKYVEVVEEYREKVFGVVVCMVGSFSGLG